MNTKILKKSKRYQRKQNRDDLLHNRAAHRSRTPCLIAVGAGLGAVTFFFGIEFLHAMSLVLLNDIVFYRFGFNHRFNNMYCHLQDFTLSLMN